MIKEISDYRSKVQCVGVMEWTLLRLRTSFIRSKWSYFHTWNLCMQSGESDRVELDTFGGHWPRVHCGKLDTKTGSEDGGFLYVGTYYRAIIV